MRYFCQNSCPPEENGYIIKVPCRGWKSTENLKSQPQGHKFNWIVGSKIQKENFQDFKCDQVFTVNRAFAKGGTARVTEVYLKKKKAEEYHCHGVKKDMKQKDETSKSLMITEREIAEKLINVEKVAQIIGYVEESIIRDIYGDEVPGTR
jgi:hypothetical protein